MSEKYKFKNPDGIYFITPTLVCWVDLFSKKAYRDIVLDSIEYCQNKKGLIVHAWCIMSSHLHLIVSRKGPESLPEIIRDLKKYTSVKLIEEIQNMTESRKAGLLQLFKVAATPIKRNRKHKVWQDGNHPVELLSNKMINVRLNYTHMNPVKAGVVSKAEDYIYSSAQDYCGIDGLLKLKKIN